MINITLRADSVRVEYTQNMVIADIRYDQYNMSDVVVIQETGVPMGLIFDPGYDIQMLLQTIPRETLIQFLLGNNK